MIGLLMMIALIAGLVQYYRGENDRARKTLTVALALFTVWLLIQLAVLVVSL